MKKKIFLFFKILLFFFFSLIIIGSIFLFLYIRNFPLPEKFTERYLPQSTKIYDKTGKVLLYEIYGEEKRTIVSLKDIPEYLKQAVLVAEDENFYSHKGVDLKAIIRAVLVDLKLKKPIQGGSTISQQLIRSAFLTREKTLRRKTKEVLATFLLEKRYTKDQILELYLNQIPFGSNCYGVESASQTFFGKSVKDLTLEESAILAALIKAPSYLSPYGPNKEKLFERKDYILDRMAEKGYILKEEAEKAKRKEISFQQIKNPLKAPHFTLYVVNLLEKEYKREYLEKAGLKVYTTLDWELQKTAEEIIKRQVKENRKYNAFNASLVAFSPKTGEVLALVGSADWFGTPYPEGCEIGKNCLFEPKFNIAIYGERQPGSAFKPFAYAKALEKGFTEKTILWDVQTNFGVKGSKPYIPQNYDGKFRGPISFKEALAQSINVPSVKVLYLAGIEETINLAKKMGITTLTKPPSFYGLSLVLGGGEVNLLEMVTAYGVFASEGYKTSPIFISKIEDSKGNIIKEAKITPKKIISTQVCRKISDILSDNEARAPMFGFSSPLYFKDYEVAAKTGTTQNFKDAWTIGYTPSIVVGVWVGNNNNAPMKKKAGVYLAGPIFHQFLEKALKFFPKEKFKKPSFSLTQKPILNGVLPGNHSILFYIDKNNPLGPPPSNPSLDPQFFNWEKGIENWLKTHSL